MCSEGGWTRPMWAIWLTNVHHAAGLMIQGVEHRLLCWIHLDGFAKYLGSSRENLPVQSFPEYFFSLRNCCTFEVSC